MNEMSGWAIRLLIAAVLVSSAHASDARFEATAIDPPDTTTLPFDAELYVRVHYVADQPVRIQAEGRLAGNPVPGSMNASPVHAAGEGDALVWIGYREHAFVDAVRITLADANWKTLALRDVPVRVGWRADAPAHVEAEWVKPLRSSQQTRIAADFEQTGDAGFLGGLLVTLMALSIPAYIVLQVVAWARWKGGWRWAALVPLVVMAGAFAVSLLALFAGSNLWPIWLIFLSPLACLWLVVAFVARFVVTRRAA